MPLSHNTFEEDNLQVKFWWWRSVSQTGCAVCDGDDDDDDDKDDDDDDYNEYDDDDDNYKDGDDDDYNEYDDDDDDDHLLLTGRAWSDLADF